MGHTIMDSLELTVVAMSLVFLILSGIMLLMQVTAKIVNKSDRRKNGTTSSLPQTVQTHNNQLDTKLEHVAVLTALAVASEDAPNKHYQIEKVERIK